VWREREREREGDRKMEERDVYRKETEGRGETEKIR
jgi:hypothetical protein